MVSCEITKPAVNAGIKLFGDTAGAFSIKNNYGKSNEIFYAANKIIVIIAFGDKRILSDSGLN